MEKINLKKECEVSLNRIWSDEKYKNINFIKRGYAAPREIIKNSILYIGINPSFSKDSIIGSNFYDEYNHKYFKKFNDISDNLKNKDIGWSHIDLLFHRETNQNKIYEILTDKENNGLDFIWEQLLISKKIIEFAQPIVIVVNNTLARKFLGKDQNNGKEKWIDFKFSKNINEELGTYIIEEGVLKDVPVFFTSMLTGQRALDLGSYERLIWHINFVLEKL